MSGLMMFRQPSALLRFRPLQPPPSQASFSTLPTMTAARRTFSGSQSAGFFFRHSQHLQTVRGFASIRPKDLKNRIDGMITVIAISDEIPNISARPGDRIRVKRGYFRNFLQRRKLAVYATPENLKHWKVDLEAPVITKSGEHNEKRSRVKIWDTEYANRISRLRLEWSMEGNNATYPLLAKPIPKFQIWRTLRRRYVLPHLTLEALSLEDPEMDEIKEFGVHTVYAQVRGAQGDIQKVPFTVEVKDSRPRDETAAEMVDDLALELEAFAENPFEDTESEVDEFYYAEEEAGAVEHSSSSPLEEEQDVGFSGGDGGAAARTRARAAAEEEAEEAAERARARAAAAEEEAKVEEDEDSDEGSSQSYGGFFS